MMIRACFLVLALVCIGCGQSQTQTKVERPQVYPVDTLTVYTFEYKGHKYLSFVFDGNSMGVVRDPDCPSFKKEK